MKTISCDYCPNTEQFQNKDDVKHYCIAGWRIVGYAIHLDRPYMVCPKCVALIDNRKEKISLVSRNKTC